MWPWCSPFSPTYTPGVFTNLSSRLYRFEIRILICHIAKPLRKPPQLGKRRPKIRKIKPREVVVLTREILEGVALRMVHRGQLEQQRLRLQDVKGSNRGVVIVICFCSCSSAKISAVQVNQDLIDGDRGLSKGFRMNGAVTILPSFLLIIQAMIIMLTLACQESYEPRRRNWFSIITKTTHTFVLFRPTNKHSRKLQLEIEVGAMEHGKNGRVALAAIMAICVPPGNDKKSPFKLQYCTVLSLYFHSRNGYSTAVLGSLSSSQKCGKGIGPHRMAKFSEWVDDEPSLSLLEQSRIGGNYWIKPHLFYSLS